MLHPQSFLCPLEQSVTDLAAGDTDVFEIPVAEMAQRDKRCLALAMRDHGGNQPVDEAAEARQKNGLLFGVPERSPRRARYC
jgi:adenine-specific DNA glycosylase